MKTNRIFTIIVTMFLVLPFNSHAQFFKELGKEVGSAVLSGLATSLKRENNQEENDSQDDDMPTSSRPTPVEGTKIVTHHPDLKIKLRRCEVNGKTCIIDFIITNYGADTGITLSGRNGYIGESEAFDDEGNIYTPAVQLANSGIREDDVSCTLLNDVPIKARLQIEGVSSSATMFKRIHLVASCRTLGLNSNKPIMFYNIPISREGDE